MLPTRAPTFSPSNGAAAAAAAGSSTDPLSNPHNVLLVVMTFISVLLGTGLCVARSRLRLFVRKTTQSVTYSIVDFTLIDMCITIPLSVLTAFSNFTLISALLLDSNKTGSTTQDLDRLVAGAMITVRILVAGVGLYLVDSSLRRSVWKQFVLEDYLDGSFSVIWAVFIVIIMLDPSQARFLPFMKSPFSEHSGGYPNLNVFLICMTSTIVSSLGIFILSAASSVFIPLSEVLTSTVLSGIWFGLLTGLTLLRLSRPVDVDDLLDRSRPSMAAAGGGGMQSHPRGMFSDVDSSGNPVTRWSMSAQQQQEFRDSNLEMRRSGQGSRVDEMYMTGSRAATQPIRSPTPPKRVSLGAVLDNIPEPAMPLGNAKVASYAHIVHEMAAAQAASEQGGAHQDEENGGGEVAAEAEGEGEDYAARRTYVSSDKVQNRVPFSFAYSVYDEGEGEGEVIEEEAAAGGERAVQGEHETGFDFDAKVNRNV